MNVENCFRRLRDDLIELLKNNLNNKVTKEEGKGLSCNDLTDERLKNLSDAYAHSLTNHGTSLVFGTSKIVNFQCNNVQYNNVREGWLSDVNNQKLAPFTTGECVLIKNGKDLSSELYSINGEIDIIKRDFSDAANDLRDALVAKGCDVPSGTTLQQMIGLVWTLKQFDITTAIYFVDKCDVTYKEFPYGENCIPKTDPTKEGWSFEGWKEKDASPALENIITKNYVSDNPTVILYAVFYRWFYATFHTITEIASYHGTDTYNYGNISWAEVPIIAPKGDNPDGWTWFGWSEKDVGTPSKTPTYVEGDKLKTIENTKEYGTYYGLYKATVTKSFTSASGNGLTSKVEKASITKYCSAKDVSVLIFDTLSVPAPGILTIDGIQWKFAGWVTGSDITDISKASSQIVSEDNNNFQYYALYYRDITTSFTHASASTDIINKIIRNAGKLGTQVQDKTLAPPTPNALSGYTFGGWAKSASEKNTANASMNPTEIGIRYWALYYKNIETIFQSSTSAIVRRNNKYTINASDGSVGVYEPTTVSPAHTDFSGWTFVGWVADGNHLSESNLVANNNIKIGGKYYALYKATVTASFNANGGSGVSNQSKIRYSNGNDKYANPSITLPSTSRAGYKFQGWKGSNGTTYQAGANYTFTSNSNISFTAQWKVNTMEIPLTDFMTIFQAEYTTNMGTPYYVHLGSNIGSDQSGAAIWRTKVNFSDIAKIKIYFTSWIQGTAGNNTNHGTSFVVYKCSRCTSLGGYPDNPIEKYGNEIGGKWYADTIDATSDTGALDNVYELDVSGQTGEGYIGLKYTAEAGSTMKVGKIVVE